MLKDHLSIDIVFNLFMKTDILVEILAGRRTCASCNRSYHLSHIDRDGYYMENRLPRKDISKCDDCNVKLIQRDDDTVQAIERRMKIYK